MKTYLEKIANGYFYKNIKSIVVLLFVYAAGILLGVFLYRTNDSFETQTILERFNDYFQLISEGNLSFHDSFFTLFFDGFSFLTAVFLLSFFFIGIVPIIAFIFYKGITIGFGMSCAIAVYTLYGNSLLIWQVILWNIAIAPFLIIFSSDCGLFSAGMFKTLLRNQTSFRLNHEIIALLCKYLLNLAIVTVFALIAVFITVYIH